MKKRIFSTTLVLFMLLTILASCTKKSDPDNSSNLQGGTNISSKGSVNMSGGDKTMETGNTQAGDINSGNSKASSNNAAATRSGGSAGSNGGGAGNINGEGNAKVETVKVHISEFKEYGDDFTVLSEAVRNVAGRSAAAAMAGESKKFVLELEKKTYRINQALIFNACNNMEVDGKGASLILTEEVLGMYITSCQNLAIKNLTVDYEPLVFTQGVVQEVSGNNVKVLIDKGYPTDVSKLNTDLLWSNIHDRSTGAVLAGTPHSIAFSKNAKNLGNNLIQLSLNFVSTNKGRQLQKNDVISLFHRGQNAITINDCSGLKFTNLNIYGSPMFGVGEGDGKGGTEYKNVKIVPGPKPKNATQNRVRSVNGDGMHFGPLENGPKLDGCTITHGGDDCINIQGFFFHILSVKGPRLVVTPKWDTPYKVGDTIEGYKDDGYTSVGTAKITAFKSKNDASMTTAIKKQYEYYDRTLGDDTLIYEITLDKVLPLSVGDHITSLDRVGKNASIRNSTFGYNRARGVVVKGTGVVVENNTFSNLTHPAISAHADILWCESGFPSNLTIRNNTITNSIISSDFILTSGLDQIGAITVGIAPDTKIKGFYNNYQNKNILIEGNKIINTQGFGIFASNCDGITIKNNTINKSFSNGLGTFGSLYNITPTSSILIAKSKNITVIGNSVSNSSSVKKAVEIHSTCSNIKAESGNSFK